jgi:CheY-like chemotaxis protein
MEIRLLIVDNDKHFNTVNRKVLRSAGIVDDLHIVNNGKDALDYLKSLASAEDRLPNIIVFELQTPILNGFEFIDEFSRLEMDGRNNIKLVVFTASNKQSDRQKATSKGIKHYLLKPYLLIGLREIVTQLRNEIAESSRYAHKRIGLETIL